MTNRTAVPPELRERPTDPQIKFIKGLASERNLEKLNVEQHDWLAAELLKSDEDQFVGVSVRRASDIITTLKNLPVTEAVVQQQNLDKPDVPAGRYAVENDEGELRFYKVWVSRTGYIKVYVLHGPDSSELPRSGAMGVLRKIAENVEEAARRFGYEIGSCSKCGRRLTNRISRELGIGPICGGRWFGEEFKPKIAEARQAIIDRGENPEEVVEDASPS